MKLLVKLFIGLAFSSVSFAACANPFAEVREKEITQAIQQKAEEQVIQQRQLQQQRENAKALQRQRQRAAEVSATKAAEAYRVRSINERRNEEQYQLDLESRKLDLQAKRSLVNHSEDYINADLKRNSAETDVVQSHADANRNISTGLKENLTKFQ